MASNIQNLHILLLPLMSQSHIIPMTDFGKLVANHGVTVTIVTTPLNFNRFKPIIDRAVSNNTTLNLRLRLVPIKFPSEEGGLPQGCENMDELASQDLSQKFVEASSLMKPDLEKFLDECEPKISCIVSSNALYWAGQLAQKYVVPHYVFQTFSCFTLLCSGLISSGPMRDVKSDSERFTVPNIPHKVEFTRAQMPEVMRVNASEMREMVLKMGDGINASQGMLVNSFEELESSYAQGYRKRGKNLWCIGPVSLVNKENLDKLDRGKSPSISGHNCLKWLDSMKPRSVIYACFGSLSHLSVAQLIELGLGLESSNRPFIWIIREQDYVPEVEKWLVEGGFEERVKGQGLVVKGWAPQVLILGHQSTGGFMTHCGWNSTLEGVSAGLPMITWPMFADQFLNEKFVTHVAKIGVSIGVEVFMNSVEEEKAGGPLVKKEQVKKAIEELMDEGEEGTERRKRAKKLGEIAKGAIEEGGSSYKNILGLIQDVLTHQEKSKSEQLKECGNGKTLG